MDTKKAIRTVVYFYAVLLILTGILFGIMEYRQIFGYEPRGSWYTVGVGGFCILCGIGLFFGNPEAIGKIIVPFCFIIMGLGLVPFTVFVWDWQAGHFSVRSFVFAPFFVLPVFTFYFFTRESVARELGEERIRIIEEASPEEWRRFGRFICRMIMGVFLFLILMAAVLGTCGLVVWLFF